MPIAPNATKLARHPQRAIRNSAIGADSMPPRRDPRNSTPLARPRSRTGNHREKLRATFGNAPASPAPKRKRIATSDRNPRAAPVSIVNADHHSTIRVRTLRGPLTSPSQPDGTSKSE
jgi:hypothetical protein